MLPIVDIAFRLLAVVCLVIVLGLTAALVSNHYNSQVVYALFTAIFAMLSVLLYGALALFIETLAQPIIMVVIMALNFIFTVSATAALAAALGVHSCTNNYWVKFNGLIAGSVGRCRQLQASVVFLAVLCAMFLSLLILWIVFLAQNGIRNRKASKA